MKPRVIEYRVIESYKDLRPGEVLRYELDGAVHAVLVENADEIIAAAREREREAAANEAKTEDVEEEGKVAKDPLGR